MDSESGETRSEFSGKIRNLGFSRPGLDAAPVWNHPPTESHLDRKTYCNHTTTTAPRFPKATSGRNTENPLNNRQKMWRGS